MRPSLRNIFFFIIGVTFTVFLFSIQYFELFGSRDLRQVPDRSRLVPVNNQLPEDLPPVDCNCESEKSGKSYDFCYKNPHNPQLIGKKFDCSSLVHLENLALVENSGPYQDLTQKTRDETSEVFVTAFSDNHYNEGSSEISSIRKFYKTQKIIVYSLKLTKTYKEILAKEHPGIEIRDFEYSKYPKMVENWMEYRFKPLIISEVMKEYMNIWWIDAHVSVKKPGMRATLYTELAEGLTENKNPLNSSILFFIHASHSNFAVMFPELLQYFPQPDLSLLKDENRGAQLGANTIYIARTPHTIEIFKWWILCALDSECMNPKGAQVFCHFKQDRYNYFANCYRFDQSVINLLLLNEQKDHHKYHASIGSSF